MDVFGYYAIFVIAVAATLAMLSGFQYWLSWRSDSLATLNGYLQRNQLVSASCLMLNALFILIEASNGRNSALRVLGELCFDVSSFALINTLFTSLSNAINTARVAIHASADESEAGQILLMFNVFSVMLLVAEIVTGTLRAVYNTYVFSIILICCYILILVVGVSAFWGYIRHMYILLEEIQKGVAADSERAEQTAHPLTRFLHFMSSVTLCVVIVLAVQIRALIGYSDMCYACHPFYESELTIGSNLYFPPLLGIVGACVYYSWRWPSEVADAGAASTSRPGSTHVGGARGGGGGGGGHSVQLTSRRSFGVAYEKSVQHESAV